MNPLTKKLPLQRLIVTLALAASAATAGAQTWQPPRPITLVWPFAPGGTVDAAVRAFASSAGKRLNQSVIVENRTGANGMIALNSLMQAAPDGQTIMFVTNGIVATLPLVSRRYKHAPGKDYIPVSHLFAQYMVFGAHPSVPFRDLRGLIDYAKKNPGKLNIATSGTAATTTFALALLTYKAGIELTNVPYKGAPAATPDLLANRVQLQVMGPGLKPLMDSGKLVAIAVTGQKRWSIFPNTPTMIESGLADTWSDISFGMIVPMRTPPAVIAALNTHFNASLATPEVKAALEVMGSEPIGTTPEEYATRIKAEQDYWVPIVKAANIRAEDD